MPRTCSSRRCHAGRSSALGRQRWTNIASTSRRMARWSGAFSPSWSIRRVLKKVSKETHDERELVVTEEDMAYVVSRMTGIPLSKIEEAESQRLLNMEEELHKRVVGQEEAIAVVTRAIRRSRAGLKDPRRPVGTFIFLG